MGLSTTTFYKLKSKYGILRSPEALDQSISHVKEGPTGSLLDAGHARQTSQGAVHKGAVVIQVTGYDDQQKVIFACYIVAREDVGRDFDDTLEFGCSGLVVL